MCVYVCDGRIHKTKLQINRHWTRTKSTQLRAHKLHRPKVFSFQSDSANAESFTRHTNDTYPCPIFTQCEFHLTTTSTQKIIRCILGYILGYFSYDWQKLGHSSITTECMLEKNPELSNEIFFRASIRYTIKQSDVNYDDKNISHDVPFGRTYFTEFTIRYCCWAELSEVLWQRITLQ